LLLEGVELVRRPFLDTPRFTAQQAKHCEEISQDGIHVERAIRRMEVYQILNFIPSSMEPIALKKSCMCRLSSLMNPLIKEIKEAMQVGCASTHDPIDLR